MSSADLFYVILLLVTYSTFVLIIHNQPAFPLSLINVWEFIVHQQHSREHSALLLPEFYLLSVMLVPCQMNEPNECF